MTVDKFLDRFQNWLSEIENLIDKEREGLTSELNEKNIAKAYKILILQKILDSEFILSKKASHAVTIIIDILSQFKNDEVFVLLVLLSKIILDTVSRLETKENKKINVSLTEMFIKIIRLFDTSLETSKSGMIETQCILCNKTIKVENDKRDFVHICKECLGE